MAEIHAARRARVQEQVAEAGADAVLVTAAPNVRYLTGLASSNAAVLVPAQGTAVLATDSRYALAAQRDCPDLELIVERFIEPRPVRPEDRRTENGQGSVRARAAGHRLPDQRSGPRRHLRADPAGSDRAP